MVETNEPIHLLLVYFIAGLSGSHTKHRLFIEFTHTEYIIDLSLHKTCLNAAIDETQTNVAPLSNFISKQTLCIFDISQL